MTYPDTIPSVTEVEVIGRYRLRLAFNDGLVREVDLRDQLDGPIYEDLRDPDYFARVEVDPVGGTIRWPNEADFDPVILHGDEHFGSGPPLNVLREYRISQKETPSERIDRLAREHPIRLGKITFSQPWRPFGLRILGRSRDYD